MHLSIRNQNNFRKYKWNLNIKSKKIKSLIVNTRNANAFTGPEGYRV